MTQSPPVIRSRSGIVLTILVWALATVGAVTAVVIGWPPAAPISFVTASWLVWLLFWRPGVAIGENEVQLRNIVRDTSIPYGAIDSVDTRYALTLTSHGRTYRSWALSAPSGGQSKRLSGGHPGQRPGDSPETQIGAAAQLIRRRVDAATRGGDAHTQVQPVLVAVSGALVAMCATLSLFAH